VLECSSDCNSRLLNASWWVISMPKVWTRNLVGSKSGMWQAYEGRWGLCGGAGLPDLLPDTRQVDVFCEPSYHFAQWNLPSAVTKVCGRHFYDILEDVFRYLQRFGYCHGFRMSHDLHHNCCLVSYPVPNSLPCSQNLLSLFSV